VFMKATSCIVGPNDTVLKPRGSTKMDWEVELGVVIGSLTRYVSEADAAKHIAGYCVINDLSERAFQLERGGQWDKGKGCDTFGPLGPWLVTSDEVGDPANLAMWLDVNGTRRQHGSTRTMIFKPAFLVHYLSQFMSLQPGDVITTGTPPGVGMGIKPNPIFLNAGDVMELGHREARHAAPGRGAGLEAGATVLHDRHQFHRRPARAGAAPAAARVVRLHRPRLVRRAHLGAQSRGPARAPIAPARHGGRVEAGHLPPRCSAIAGAFRWRSHPPASWACSIAKGRSRPRALRRRRGFPSA
jgi:hypothetical protein